MASGPFKIRLKLSKAVESRDDLAQPDSKPQGRKRLRTEESDDQVNAAAQAGLVSRIHQGEKPAAEPDRKPTSAFAHPNIQSSGREAPEGSAAPTRPRLVIKGSFGGSTPKTQRISSPLGSAPKAAHSDRRDHHKKLHKEKKRKKHRERPLEGPQPFATPAQEDESALPLSAPLLQPALPRKEHKAPALPSKVPASPVQFKPESARGLSQLVKAEPAATTSTSGAEIPSLVAVKAASQVPSFGTGLSADGLTQASDKLNNHAGALGQEAVSKPEAQPSAGDVERLINRLQTKDQQHFFKAPVTDAVAPGYTQIIKRPMSFSQMRDRLAKEEYTSWRSVQEDLETMFNNAMVFNGPKTPYHLKAREMMGIARKLLHTIRTTGHLEPRGRKPAAALKPPQPNHSSLTAPIAERRPERKAAARPEKAAKPRVDKKKVAARKAAIRAAASGVLAKPGVDDARGDLGGLVGEQSGRATFPQLQGQPVETQWGGLAGGASAEGVEYGKGRPALRANFSGMLSLNRFSKSLRAFGEKLSGFAMELLEKKLAAAAKTPEPQPTPVVARPSTTATHQPWAPSGAAQMAWTPLAHSRPPVTPATSLPQALARPGAYLMGGGLQPYNPIASSQPHSHAQQGGIGALSFGPRHSTMQGSAPGVSQQPGRPYHPVPPVVMSGVSVKVEPAAQSWPQPRPNVRQAHPTVSQPMQQMARPVSQPLPGQMQAVQGNVAQQPRTNAAHTGTLPYSSHAWSASN